MKLFLPLYGQNAAARVHAIALTRISSSPINLKIEDKKKRLEAERRNMSTKKLRCSFVSFFLSNLFKKRVNAMRRTIANPKNTLHFKRWPVTQISSFDFLIFCVN
jgi:hypothetical protein